MVLVAKSPPANAGDTGDPGSISELGRSHGQMSLVGYSPRDHKESDMMEQLSTHICITENSDWYKAFVIIMLQTSTLKSLI